MCYADVQAWNRSSYLGETLLQVTNNFFGLLAKYPEAGMVKTRLARNIGGEGAARIYKIIAEQVINNTTSGVDGKMDFERIIFYSPADARSRVESWIRGERLLPQRGNDIGEIMANALSDLFDLGAANAVITGADIPDLNRNIISDAFLKLKNADVVIGPAEDGGYYLIGMKSAHAEIFQGISWSTEKVFGETIRVIQKIGLSYSVLKTLCDVDKIEDIAGIRDFISD